MKVLRKKRLFLILGLMVGISVAAWIALNALSQNINHYWSPTEMVEGKAAPNKRMRAGGVVVKNSLKRTPDSLKNTFDVTDFNHTITIEFMGILPDLFREGQGIVALGMLNNQNIFVADEVLAKHDENYMPPEVAQTLLNKDYSPKIMKENSQNYNAP